MPLLDFSGGGEQRERPEKVSPRSAFSVCLAWLFLFLLLSGSAFGFVLNPPPSTPPPAQSLYPYSSSISVGKEPVRIAAGKSGTLYVAAPASGKILKFSQGGSPSGEINGFKRPLSVAVDSGERVYAGDFGDGSVAVLGTSGQVLFRLGKGAGEFGIPGSIAVAANGSAYVADSKNNVVKVYDSSGTFKFSFGGYGTGTGQMIFPTGVAVDDAQQEVYVVDQNNGRVEVFSSNGTFKRSFGSFGSGQGQLTRPGGISVAGGKVFVADAFQSNVEVFDTAGAFVGYVGQFGTDPGMLKIPMDVVKNGTKLFVSNTSNRRIEVFDAGTDPNGLVVTPSLLTFSTTVNMNPLPQNIQVAPAVAGTNVSWTVSAAPSFIQIDRTSGNTSSGASTVVVSLSAAGLGAGDYTGTVTVAANGISYPVDIRLTVAPSPIVAQLMVAPASLALVHQRGGDLASGALSVTASSGTLQWTASADVPWLTLSQTSGSTPGTISVSLNQNSDSLGEGTVTGKVTVSVAGAAGSPVNVSVSLRVLIAGTIVVNANIPGASFSITGPSSYSGNGTTWKTDEAKPGSYTIQFGHVKGFRTPPARTFEVKTGKTTTIDAQYLATRVANAIVGGKGPDPKNEALVRVLDLNGSLVNEFTAFTSKYGAVVALGDIDGDGADEIIVVPGHGATNQAAMKVFRYDGSLLAEVASIAGTRYGANVAAGDIDGDGRSEIALAVLGSDKLTHTIIIYSSDANRKLTERGRFSVKSSGQVNSPASVAFADLDGDGRLELVVSYATIQDGTGRIEAYDFDEQFSAVLRGSAATPSAATVAGGDFNGEGRDELLIGYNDGIDSVVHMLDGDLTNDRAFFKAFGRGKSAPGLSAMDSNNDAVPEVLASSGDQPANSAVVRIFSSGGTQQKEIVVFEFSSYGVSAAFGRPSETLTPSPSPSPAPAPWKGR